MIDPLLVKHSFLRGSRFVLHTSKKTPLVLFGVGTFSFACCEGKLSAEPIFTYSLLLLSLGGGTRKKTHSSEFDLK